MIHFGQFLRHGIAIFAMSIVGTLLLWVGVDPALLTAEQAEVVNKAAAALETFIWFFLTWVVYPWTEKFLKRYRSIDAMGYIDRKWLKREATYPSTETRHML